MTAGRTHAFPLSRRPGCFLRVTLLALALPLLATPNRVESRTAQSTVELIQAGWDGNAVHDTWTPVRLRVHGGVQEGDVLAEVIVETEMRVGAQRRATRYPVGSYGHELSLPPGEAREVTVWFPASADGSLVARARLSANGETLAEAEVPIEVGRAGWPLIGVLAEGEAVGRLLGSIELPYQGLPVPLAVAELEVGGIPESSDRFEAFSALVVQGVAATELTDTQRAAVLDWVEGGGDLVLSGGPGAAHTLRVLPEAALPVTYVDFDATASIRELQAWITATSEVPTNGPAARFRPEGGVVLAGSEESPLAWRRQVGRGTVTLLAIDPALDPIARWAGSSDLLRAALSPALPDDTDDAQRRMWLARTMPMHLQTVAGMLPPDAHPRWPLAAVLLACFTIAVGPILYFLLQRIDRRELSWIVVPLIAVCASGGIYLWGVRANGSDLVANVGSYIEIEPGDVARQSVLAAFYGPTHRELSVPLDQETAVRASAGPGEAVPWQAPMGGQGGWSEEADWPIEAPFQVIEGANPRVRFIGGQYGPRQIFFERELPDAPRVHAEVSVEDGLLVGTVRNDTELTLENAALIVGRNLLRLGTLAPGQSVPVRLDPLASSDLWSHHPHSAKIFGKPVSGPTRNAVPVGDDEWRAIPNDPESQRRAAFLEQVLDSRGAWMSGSNQALSVVAFTRAPTVDASFFSNRPNHQLTLLMQKVNLTLRGGPFTLPPGVTPLRLMNLASGLGGGGGGNVSWTELRGGSVIFAFRPPLPPQARAETLILTTEAIAEAAAAAPPAQGGAHPSRADIVEAAAEGVFSVYDWRRDEWSPLPARTEHHIDPTYLDPDGEVRVRIGARNNQLLRFLLPTLAVEGHVEAGGQR